MKTKTAVKTASPATPTVKSITKTVFAFKKRSPIPTKGIQKASWISAINECLGDGSEMNVVVVTVQLEEKDGNSKPFVLKKNYNIREGGRGFKAFIDDTNAWADAGLTEDDLYVERDYTKEFGGQELVVDIGHRKTGPKEWEAYLLAFHPAGYDGPAAGESEASE
jgi:hypothetical protein